MYAVVVTGGKQYKVQEGDTLYIEKLDAEPGQKVELTEVLLVEKDGQVKVGTPKVDGAKIVLDVVRHGKGHKIIVFK